MLSTYKACRQELAVARGVRPLRFETTTSMKTSTLRFRVRTRIVSLAFVVLAALFLFVGLLVFAHDKIGCKAQ